MAVSKHAKDDDIERRAIPEDRCGYVHDLSTIEDLGESCCYRPSWTEGGRCVWHANENDLPSEYYEDATPLNGERLDGAHVPPITLIRRDWFEGCTLIGATFHSTVIRESSFVGSDLREARFDNVDARDADFSEANLAGASITSTDFRGATFKDARFDQAVITNTRVNRETDFGKETRYDDQSKDAASKEEYRREAEAAVWTYREIHSLFVDNALPLKARKFYYKEKDMRRRLAWHMGHYVQALKAEGSRWVTGYGMNPYRVIATAIFVILVSAFLYPITGGIEESTGDGPVVWTITDLTSDPLYVLYVYVKSLYFSSITFSTLGYGDISPIGLVARILAAIESLLGALLTALLVFVLSRRIS